MLLRENVLRNSLHFVTYALKHVLMKFLKTYPKSYPINFVAGYQSVGLVVFDHDVVAVGETAQFFAVASVNGGQIAVAKINFSKQQPCAAVGGGDLVEVV